MKVVSATIAALIGITLLTMGILGFVNMPPAKATAQTISLKDLAANGPGDNFHVEITHLLVTQSFADQIVGKKKVVWVPLVEPDGEYVQMIQKLSMENHELVASGKLPPPKNIRILLKSDRIEDDPADPDPNAQLESLLGGGEGPLTKSNLGIKRFFTGMIINDIDPLTEKDKTFLKKHYPDLNTDTVLVFEYERRPPRATRHIIMIGSGLAAIVLALIVYLIPGKSRDED